MHHRAVVIWSIEVVCILFVKVMFKITDDIFIVDLYINVSVTSTLLMPEAECMEEFMLNDAVIDASISY